MQTPNNFHAWALLVVCACGPAHTHTVNNLPLLTPPVKAAMPRGLGGSTATRDVGPGTETPLASFHDRFFSGSGPTDVLSLLANIDGTVNGINMQLASSPACASATGVAYDITAFTDTEHFSAQCASTLGGMGLNQFAVVDGVTYLFNSVGQMRVAAIVKPIDASHNEVEAWIGVGYLNATTMHVGNSGPTAWDAGSYGVIHLKANALTGAFEMAVAGIGFGFCGAQLQSDGHLVSMTGSTDMGSTCNAPQTACAAASDLAPATGCAPAFSLTPLGRLFATASPATHAGPLGTSSFAASLYPATPNVTLDGSMMDALNFGPLTATPNVGTF